MTCLSPCSVDLTSFPILFSAASHVVSLHLDPFNLLKYGANIAYQLKYSFVSLFVFTPLVDRGPTSLQFGIQFHCSYTWVPLMDRLARRQTTWGGPYRPTPFVRRPHVARNTNRIFDIYLIRNLWTLLESWLVSVKLGRVY